RSRHGPGGHGRNFMGCFPGVSQERGENLTWREKVAHLFAIRASSWCIPTQLRRDNGTERQLQMETGRGRGDTWKRRGAGQKAEPCARPAYRAGADGPRAIPERDGAAVGGRAVPAG